MIGWGVILFGAALSALLAGTLVGGVAGEHRVVAGFCALAGAGLGPIAWNAILRATHAEQFFTDAPLAVLPASWQDAGSGVFAFAVTYLIMGLGPFGSVPARRVGLWALAAALVAFLVDVYLY